MAVDIYLLLYDQNGNLVKGECQDVVFKNAIEINKLDFIGVAHNIEETIRDSEVQRQRRDRELSRAEEIIPTNWFQDDVVPIDSFEFTVVKSVDYASPALYLFFCQERLKLKSSQSSLPFQKAQVYFCIQGQPRTAGASMSSVSMLAMEFQRLHVKQYGLYMDSETGVPDETVTFIFETYTMAYAPQQADGSLGTPRTLGYDFVNETTL